MPLALPVGYFVGIMGAKKDKERKIAEDLFVRQGWTAKAIADLLNVRESTIGDWRVQDDWEALRESTQVSPLAIRKLILKELKSILDGNKPTLDADNLIKLAKVNDSLGDKITPEVVINVMMLLDEYMAEQNPKLSIECLDIHKRFIRHFINVNG